MMTTPLPMILLNFMIILLVFSMLFVYELWPDYYFKTQVKLLFICMYECHGFI